MVRRDAALVILVALLVGTSPTNAAGQFLRQNWNAAERQSFYTTSQGSRMMPYAWFLAMETSTGQDSFLRVRIPELGYIANENPTNNPDQLPVGFVADNDISGKRYIGLNCAACHTNQIQYQGNTYQIDGAPTQADIWGLLEGIDESLSATRRQPEKFSRFANKVLGSRSSNSRAVEELRTELNEFLQYWNQFIIDSRVSHPWGRGRLDAFGMIFNRVTSIDLGIPANSRKPDAPVSYPFLWGTSFEDRVQWNGSAENSNDIERLGRNVGEVLGVFGQAQFRAIGRIPEVRTSARRLNQVKLENLVKDLWSPVWPDALGAIDETKKAAGQALFAEHCKKCHKIIPHGHQNTPVKVTMTPLSLIGTDPKMAVNAATGVVSTGKLKRAFGFRKKMPRGELLQRLVRLAIVSPFRDVRQNEDSILSIFARGHLAPSSQLFTPTDVAAFVRELNVTREEALERVKSYEKKLEAYYQDLKEADEWTKALRSVAAGSDGEEVPRPLRYKARPLDGIWATAPYLHNGSVPNLYELLLPSAERTKTFYVGNNEFDPEKVGFKTDQSPGTTKFDTTKPGNSNAGHDMYGTFNEEERWQLVEYMKSL